jgi:hypothetical protein
VPSRVAVAFTLASTCSGDSRMCTRSAMIQRPSGHWPSFAPAVWSPPLSVPARSHARTKRVPAGIASTVPIMSGLELAALERRRPLAGIAR